MHNAYYYATCVYVCGRVCSPLCSEHLARLLCDANEGGSPAQLFELSGAHVGAGGAEAPQHVTDGVLHVSSIGNLHRPSLRRPESREEKVGIRNNISEDISRRIGSRLIATTDGTKFSGPLTCTQQLHPHISSWPCRSSCRRRVCISCRSSR